VKRIGSILLLVFIISKLQSQDPQLVYSTPIEPLANLHGITSENGRLYILTSHDIVIASYDCNTQVTDIQEIMSFDTTLTFSDMYLTDDWIYLSVHKGHRSIRRVNRNDPNAELEMVANYISFPSALVVTQTSIYYRDYESIYKLNLNDLSLNPELIIEDWRFDFSADQMALNDGFIYATARDVIYKINTTNDEVESIALPGVELEGALVSIGTDKLLGKSNNELFVIDLIDNSIFSIGFINCDIGPPLEPWGTACGYSDLAVIDSSLYITGAESRHVFTFKLPTSGFADADEDTFGDPETKVDIINNNFSKAVVLEGTDCDDNNPNVNPGQTEIPYNGLDDDCNALSLDDDLDQDGFPLADDCNDEDAGINPEADDIPDNDIDEDCDGVDFVSSTHDLTNASLEIYPNPATDVIKIEVDGPLEFKVNLYDLKGALMSAAKNTNLKRVSTLPAGIYLLEIQDLNSAEKIVERIVIER